MEPDFHMFGLAYLVAPAVTAAVVVWLIRLYQQPATDLIFRRRIEKTAAGIMIPTVLLDPLVNWLRWPLCRDRRHLPRPL